MFVCVRVYMMMSFRFHDNVKFPFEIAMHICFFGHSCTIFRTQFHYCASFLSFSLSNLSHSMFFLLFFLLFFSFRIIYFMWWNTWTVVIWCSTFKLRDALPNIKQNSSAPKSYRDWNFYIRTESFIGMCNDIKPKTKEWNSKIKEEKKHKKNEKPTTHITLQRWIACLPFFVELFRSNKSERPESIMVMVEYRRLIKTKNVQRLNQKRNKVK